MEPIRDEVNSSSALKIIEKYETFLRYVYPMLKNLSGEHRVVRDKTLEQIVAQIGLFNDAAKSKQISRLYLADAGLATIRDHLRFLAWGNIKLLSKKQYGVSTLMLAEVGSMLNGWIKKTKERQKGR